MYSPHLKRTNSWQGDLALSPFPLLLSRSFLCLSSALNESQDNLPKKLQIFLTNMTKHCRIPSRDSQQVDGNGSVKPDLVLLKMSSVPEIQKVFKKRSAQIRRVFLSYSQEDTEDLGDGKDETMNLKELYQFMKDSQQMVRAASNLTLPPSPQHCCPHPLLGLLFLYHCSAPLLRCRTDAE